MMGINKKMEEVILALETIEEILKDIEDGVEVKVNTRLALGLLGKTKKQLETVLYN